MKTPVLIMGLLLLAMLVPPAGHSAHHRHRYPVSTRSQKLLPLRVVRTPAVAQQHRQVHAVR